jgi:hypothetical protein
MRAPRFCPISSPAPDLPCPLQPLPTAVFVLGVALAMCGIVLHSIHRHHKSARAQGDDAPAAGLPAAQLGGDSGGKQKPMTESDRLLPS